MKTLIAAVAFASLGLLLAPGGAGAQYVVRGYSVVSGPSTIPSTAPLGRIAVATVGGTYIPPYSYTVVPNSMPARRYQGYGPNDFPYYGRPYGRVYDPWTWTYLQGGHYNTLARYYTPPLGF